MKKKGDGQGKGKGQGSNLLNGNALILPGPVAKKLLSQSN